MMNLVKVGDGTYINVDRMTFTERGRKETLAVHFAVGGGSMAGPACFVTLKGQEASDFIHWLDARSKEAPG